MVGRYSWWCAAFSLLAFVAPVAAQVEPIPADTEEEIGAEVLTAMESYFRAYAESDEEWLRQEMFATPYLSLGESGPTVETSREDRSQRIERVMQSLADEGWADGGYLDPEVCVVNRALAWVSGTYTRYRADGSVLNERGGTYVFVREEPAAAWRMLASLSHEQGKVLSC